MKYHISSVDDQVLDIHDISVCKDFFSYCNISLLCCDSASDEVLRI